MKPRTRIPNSPASGAVLPSVKPGQVVVGIDEVGRGAWAGPLLVVAVALTAPAPAGLTDSKLLSRARREVLAAEIRDTAAGIGFGWVPVRELDEVGLAAALKLGAHRAVESLGCPYDLIVIDGTSNFLPGYPVVTLANADYFVPQVAAASIVAKVARDRYMARLHAHDSRYGFDAHVGYGTAHHRAMLERHGASPHHRTSFQPIKNLSAA
ncbi:MAG TPA: ribonuclease HII [Candidatus Saccharimonadia bacterium]|nr:ribonuclease HII [Candidatus Saccharimonadia bacterium]